MRINWFNKMLLSYLPVFFVISLSLLLMTYLTLNEMSRQSAVKANELLSQSIIQLIDNTLMDVNTMMQQQLLDNSRIKAFFQPGLPSTRQQADYQAAAALNELMNHYRIIDSIYLFRTNDQKVLTPSSFASIENFGDKQFIAKHINSLHPFRWIEKRPYAESADDQVRYVVSLAAFGNLADGSLMVVNVSTNSLGDMIRRMSESDLNFVDLLDAEGRLIASKETDDAAGDTGIEPLPNKGREFSSVRSSYTGWTIRSGIYDASILEWVSSLFYVWVAIGFLAVAAGIIWLVFVTSRNYKPIRVIMNRISAYPYRERSPKQESVKDELQYIGHAIDDLLDRSSLLQEQNKENLAYRKKQVFLSMVEGVPMAESWETELQKVGIEAYGRQCAITLVEIDRFHEFDSRFGRRDQYLLRHVVGSVTAEIALNAQTAVWSEWVSPGRLGTLYLFKDVQSADQELRLMCRKLLEWVRQHLMFTVTIGIGNTVVQPEHIAESYGIALQALAYKASFGPDRLIGQEDLISTPSGEWYRHLQDIRVICQTYRSGGSEWEEQLDEMHRSLRTQLYTREGLGMLHDNFIYHLRKQMTELPEEFQELWDGKVWNRMSEIQAKAETVDAWHADFRQELARIFEDMRKLRESKHNYHLIQNVKSYINGNFGNPDLSLNHLSHEFGLGASYLSRLFKEEFGVKFIDYVTQVRMEKAEELLQQSVDSVQHIAAVVGYPRSLTFIRVFKKYKGTTPGSYRKKFEK